MSCPYMKEKLSEYLDGTLSSEDRAYVEEHVATCEDCAQTLAELRSTLGHLGSLGDVETPPWFTEKVMQRVHEETGSKSLLRKLFFPLHIKLPAEAFAVAMVAVVAVYVFHAMNPEVAMKEAALSERQVAAEQPEADVAEPETFFNPTDKKAEPFAPSGASTTPDEAEWTHEEISEKSGGEVAAMGNEQIPEKREAPEAGLMKPEPTVGEFRAKEKAVIMRDAAAPASEGEESLDDLAPAEKLYGVKAAMPGPKPDVRLTVEIDDVAFARQELETAITELGGKVIDEKGQPDNVILAEMGAAKLDEFLEKVEKTGEIKSKAVITSGERLYIRIELLEGAGP